MEYFTNTFSHIPLELIIPFSPEFPVQSIPHNNFNSITLSAHMMKNPSDHTKEFKDNNITSSFESSVTNGNKNKTELQSFISPFRLKG